MKIRMLGHVISGPGAFKPGDEVDWPERDAKPLVDSGSAEIVKESAAKKAPAKKKRGKS